jgi:hypothetical protein
MKLQEVIDKEDKANPLSDDDLVHELGKHGLTVARRTVTKYRKAMNIPSSRQRRDWSATPKQPNGDTAQTNGTQSAVPPSQPANLNNGREPSAQSETTSPPPSVQ